MAVFVASASDYHVQGGPSTALGASEQVSLFQDSNANLILPILLILKTVTLPTFYSEL